MNEIFIEKDPSYELRDGGDKYLPKVKTVRFGTENVRFLGQMVWRTQTADMKESESLSVYERKIKLFTVSRDCRQCKRYIEILVIFDFILHSYNCSWPKLAPLCYCILYKTNFKLNKKCVG